MGFKEKKELEWISVKVTLQKQNRYLDYLIEPGYQGKNRFFALQFENDVLRIRYKRYSLATAELKD